MSKEYKPVQVPCKFFLQGTCFHGNSCRFSHQIQSGSKQSAKQTFSNRVCRYFQSPSGCNAKQCKFLHDGINVSNPHDDQLAKEDKSFQQTLCKCVQPDFARLSCKPKKFNTNKCKSVPLCVLEFPLDTLNKIFQPNTKQLSTTFWFRSGHIEPESVLIRIRQIGKSKSSQQQSIVEGPNGHIHCILKWIETKLGLLCCKNQLTDIEGNRMNLLCYSTYLPGEPIPQQLETRLWNVFKSKPDKKNIQQSPTLDSTMKSLILQYEELSSAETESEDEEDEELGLEEEDDEPSESEESETLSDDETALIERAEEFMFSDFLFRLASGSKESIHKQFDSISPNEGISLFLSEFLPKIGGAEILKFSSGAMNMLNEASAGCGTSSQISEALSFEVFHRLFGFEFSLAEMQIEYNQPNAPRLDYLCQSKSSLVGVSVTRAWNGGTKPYLQSNASQLLLKKLNGLNRARDSVALHQLWDIQLLHIWVPNRRIGRLLSSAASQLGSNFTPSCPTVILLSYTQFHIPLEYSFLYRCD